MIKRVVINNQLELTEYDLRNSDGDTLKLAIEVDSGKKLLFFEFVEERLFLIMNHFELMDVVGLYSFDTQTGKRDFYLEGQIPCQSKFKHDWAIGNKDCEWINFKEDKVVLVRMENPLVFKLSEYDWKRNKGSLIPIWRSILGLMEDLLLMGISNRNFNRRKKRGIKFLLINFLKKKGKSIFAYTQVYIVFCLEIKKGR
ncbi:MAG: hypothetical protein AAFP19_23945 [Bacteroidota bacterium]